MLSRITYILLLLLDTFIIKYLYEQIHCASRISFVHIVTRFNQTIYIIQLFFTHILNFIFQAIDI